MTEYKLTIIAENTVYRHNACAQHGLSVLIETSHYKLLFDVGEVSTAILHNLKTTKC